MRNSESLPCPEEQERLINEYEKRFGLGSLVSESFKSIPEDDNSGWKNRPAQKATSKIFLNSVWGKHCERVNLPKLEIINEENGERMRDLYQNFSSNKLKLLGLEVISNDRVQLKYESDLEKPDLHKGYLPAGLFVPAYGRLVLYEELVKLDKRVLMHDTDSIIYIHDPELYNPKENDILGCWKRESIDVKNGGIREFVGLAPKSYALRCANGTEILKVKGVSIKLSHRDILNFNSLKDLVFENKEVIKIPQFNFVQGLGKEMKTNYFLKEIKFHKGKGKGDYNKEEKIIYPYCYKKD